jgi:colanic acid biosynthesis glycosyl transferase WcaI
VTSTPSTPGSALSAPCSFLLLNQTFHPDVAATAQYLTDVARGLATAGHEVQVIASRRAYDEAEKFFAARETWNGIRISRVFATGFGKRARWRRALDFASFMLSCSLRLLFTRRPDVVIALTSPPLISFLAACFASVRRCRFIYWVMDLNPDEAIVAGWLGPNSFAARFLERLSRFSLRRANAVVVLDRFMRERVLAKGISPERVHILPPWSHDDAIRYDEAGRNQFRAAHGLTEKFVVMYSGNHSPCHPLDTLLEAARALALNSQPSTEICAPRSSLPAPGSRSVAFCFVGGGSEFAKVKRFAAEHNLQNILCLPYQPLSELSASLSAADLHVVVMGEPFVGTIHPCKIYNVLTIGSPVLYIGPDASHVTDIFAELASSTALRANRHHDVTGVIDSICAVAALPARTDANAFQKLAKRFSQSALVPEFLRICTAAP